MTDEQESPDVTGESMAHVAHTRPHTYEPIGEPFRRGEVPAPVGETDERSRMSDHDPPEIQTDGGEPAPLDEPEDPGLEPIEAGRTGRDDGEERDERGVPTMAEVDHAGTTDVSTAFERGPARDEEIE